MKKRFEFGNAVVDNISGFCGIVVARCESMTGPDRYEVQPTAIDNGNKMPESVWLDVDRLESLSDKL